MGKESGGVEVSTLSFDFDRDAPYLSLVLQSITQAKSELAGPELSSQSQRKRRRRAEGTLKTLLQTLGDLPGRAILSFLDAPTDSVDLLTALIGEEKEAPFNHENRREQSRPLTKSERELLYYTAEWHKGAFIASEMMFSAQLQRTFCAELASIGTDHANALRAVFRLLTAQTLIGLLEGLRQGRRWQIESSPLAVVGAKNLQSVSLGGSAVREMGRLQAEAIQAVSEEILNSRGFKGIENHCRRIMDFFDKHPERRLDCMERTDRSGTKKHGPSRSTIRRAIEGRIPAKP